jgi:trk system potassium uptake protein TrkH
MAISRIILWLGNSLILVAGLLVITAIGGVVFSEQSEAALFASMGMIVGLIGVIFVGATRSMSGRETNTDALVFLLLFWMIIPVVLAMPYGFLGVVENSYAAYFEAVSAITTTGASTLDPDSMSKSLHIWRSALQWTGGVVVATFAVVVLAALNLRGTGVHRSMLFTFRKGELFDRLVGIGRVIAGLYAGISLICFIVLIFSGTPVFDAICLALTSVSTGGLTPRSGVLAEYVNHVGLFALGLSCLLGAFNVALIWDAVRLRAFRGVKGLVTDVEHRTLFFIIGVLCFVGALYAGTAHIWTIFWEAIFFASSAGYDYHVIGLDVVPAVILIAIALIGGSALSTAGGVKLIRLLLLFRHLETDLNRLSHPSRRVPVLFRGQVLPDKAFLSIWMYFFGYTIVFAIGIIALAAVGMDFEMAVTTSAASLSNMGPLLDATLPEYSYEAFSVEQLMISCVLMLVGRVEVLAVFAIASPGTWRA